jgi:hypothetical protein
MQVQQRKLSALLDDVRTAKLVIPDFQRDFVWTRKQVEELLNSVVNRYFIGTLLLLESPSSNLRFAPRLVPGVSADPTQHSSISYVLDGQQRVTSLFYAFLEPGIPLQDEALPTRFFLNLDGCQEVVGVQKIEDLLRKLHPKEEKRLLEKLREVLIQSTGIDIERYPSMASFRSPEALTDYLNAHAATLEAGKRDELNRLLQSILDYEVAVVTLPHDTPDDEIVSTFERINRLGTRLDIFDLAVARYYPLGIRLNELKERIDVGVLSIGEPVDILDYLEPDAVLRVMALSNGTEPKNKNLLGLVALRGDRNKAQAEFYTRWDAARDYLRKALRRMRDVYGAVRLRAKKNRIALIPYTSLAVPLASLIREAESLGGAKSLYDKIDAWYWTSVFAGRYAHAVESQSYSDFKAVSAWLKNDDNKPDIAADVSSVISEMRKASRTSALAKAFYNFIILNGASDFLNGQLVKLDECEVDHVFPGSKYPAGAKNIFGLSVIHKDTNRKKADKSPAEFLHVCLEAHSGDKAALAATLKAHFISAEGIRAMEGNNLEAFVVAREAAFQEALARRLLTRR